MPIQDPNMFSIGRGIFDAVQELSELMKIQGHVYPASDIPLTLNARFTE